MNATRSSVNRNANARGNGFSVRCLKDWLKEAILFGFFSLVSNFLWLINF
ncbi:hypothetical protein COY54_00340 [Candidatus Falkowbacteria bacterium CG_4_10_14_0_8_um_filter_41_36]|uniref:Uncharacterized protein n=2 Tax=Candidatus Falkowiibacteriota TaxID=1752728 RepID=A0A2G9ZN94_9BACT|nr:MAG: hypothetical protein COX21_01770 [Candidatus Falkowbacteria bacterium CG23_combo_of_CG06-09_8_20_14_all_41_10]PIZ11465.1 MAG: hypothetical protein COY54_00340 [Candidatus Falkowbacteria bacterium CG_4_10_14_0_8_um_filter_41_36]